MSETAMVSAPLAIVVTVLFAGAALFAVARLTRSRSPVKRANYGLHLLMSLAMIAMAWPETVNLLTPVQLLLFGTAIWFVGRSIVQIRRNKKRSASLDQYHAAMMGTMTLMVLSMRQQGSDMSSMSHGGRLDEALAVTGGFFAAAAFLWGIVLIVRLRGTPPSGLRTSLAGEAIYELAMAAGMTIMAFSGTA